MYIHLILYCLFFPFNLQGENLNTACEMSDFRVSIGQFECLVTLLTESVLTCSLAAPITAAGQLHNTRV